jgi:hypothetical protein
VFGRGEEAEEETACLDLGGWGSVWVRRGSCAL